MSKTAPGKPPKIPRPKKGKSNRSRPVGGPATPLDTYINKVIALYRPVLGEQEKQNLRRSLREVPNPETTLLHRNAELLGAAIHYMQTHDYDLTGFAEDKGVKDILIRVSKLDRETLKNEKLTPAKKDLNNLELRLDLLRYCKFVKKIYQRDGTFSPRGGIGAGKGGRKGGEVTAEESEEEEEKREEEEKEEGGEEEEEEEEKVASSPETEPEERKRGRRSEILSPVTEEEEESGED